MEGWTDTESKGEPLILNFITKNTRDSKTSHETKQPLKILKRKKFRLELKSDLDPICKGRFQ